MARRSRAIRVFISSTFQDFEWERNLLSQEVFPRIREQCERRGFSFQWVDLRWGVSEVDGANHLTMRICLDEIDRCIEQSPGINFVVLAGGRYGTAFAPAEIPARDWEDMERAGNLSDEDKQFLNERYRRDYNTIGSPYRLIPVDGERERRRELEKRIRDLLFPAARKALSTERFRLLYGASATEQEVEEGLFRQTEGWKHTVVALREPTTGDNNPQAAALRERLRTEMGKEGAIPLISLTEGEADYADKFCRQMEERVGNVVREYMRSVDAEEAALSPDELERQTLFDECEKANASYWDNDNTMREFTRFLEQNRGRAVLVSGETGAGKTALLKTFAYREMESVAAVFCDIQPRSMDVALHALMRQLKGMGCLSYAQEPGQDNRDAVPLFERTLERYGQRKWPIVAILDSVELIEDYRYQSDSLFRLRLPDWLTLVVSCASRENLTMEEQQCHIPKFEVNLVTRKSAVDSAVPRLLRRRFKVLTGEQIHHLSSWLPERVPFLYLEELSAMLRPLTSYDDLPQEVTSRPPDNWEMAKRLLQNTRYTAAPVLYRHLLGFFSRIAKGLSENEILNLLMKDKRVIDELLSHESERLKRNVAETTLCERNRTDSVMIASILQAHWARFRGHMEGTLLEYEERGTRLLRFRSNFLRDAARNLSAEPEMISREVQNKQKPSFSVYCDGSLARRLLEIMRDYFLGLPIYQYTETESGKKEIHPGYRWIAELYPVLDYLRDYKTAAGIFSDPRRADAYIRAGEYDRLFRELEFLISKGESAEKLNRIHALLLSKDSLFRALRDSFLFAYVQEYPDEKDLLSEIRAEAWISRESVPTGTAFGSRSMHIPKAASCASALSDNGVFAVLQGDYIRLYDADKGTYTGINYRLEAREASAAFLYWDGDELIVRFERSRQILHYTGLGELYLVSNKPCRDLPTMDADKESVLRAGGYREMDERGYTSEMLFPYHIGDELMKAELFYPLGTELRIFRHEGLAAVLVESTRLDLLELSERKHLAQWEISSAVYVRFSPDGRRLVVCTADNLLILFDVPEQADECAVPIPGASVPLASYSRNYNLAEMRRDIQMSTALLEPTYRGNLPFAPSGSNAHIGNQSPLFACMSFKRDWLACYYYRRNVARVRLFRLGTRELIAECRVPPVFPDDAASDPFYADGESAVVLRSRGVTHRWDLNTGRWTRESKKSRRFLTGNHGNGESGNIRWKIPKLDPLDVFMRVQMFFLLPGAWRLHMRRISGIDDGDIFPPFKLTGERYVWEVDRTRRIIRLLSRDGEKTLCCCGVEFPILTAALDGDTLYALPGNGTDLREFHAFPLATEAETDARGTNAQDVACTTSSSVNAVSVSSEGSCSSITRRA
ncbi:MAG: DUF4062 domain-containing protein [Oscillibacter sp.]|nr:DUF4062 domain-containing protein [Oscillibacter sp.]